MGRADRHRNKKSLFGKIYLAYLIVILLCFVAIFFYVRTMMVKYERNSADNYVLWLVKDASEDSELGKYLEEYNFSDTRFGDSAARKADFYAKAKDADMAAAPAKGSHNSLNPAYDITIDGKPFITISIKEESSVTKLGIMTLSEWSIEYAIIRDSNSEGISLNEQNALSYKLTIPEGFTLLASGQKTNLTPAEEAELGDFEYVAPYVDAPKGLIYTVDNVYFEPAFSVLNNGSEELSFDVSSDGSYFVKPEFAASPEAKTLADSVCNPLVIGKTWSKFMTDDVGGASHGLATVRSTCMLLQGTNLYSLATKWAGNVDITFVSGHTLDSFTNESVTNYVMYNENLFSCDVYFEKNMTISRGLGTRTDVFSNRMYFGKVKGNWYLLDMVSLDY